MRKKLHRSNCQQVRRLALEVFNAPAHYYQSDALSLDELAYWVAFSRIFGIGPIRFKLLLDYFHFSQLGQSSTKPAPQAYFQ